MSRCKMYGVAGIHAITGYGYVILYGSGKNAGRIRKHSDGWHATTSDGRALSLPTRSRALQWLVDMADQKNHLRLVK